MFQKENLIKHYMFLLYDMAAVLVSFLLASLIRFGTMDLKQNDGLFLQVLGLALVAYFVGNRIFRLDHKVFDRGLFAEFVAVVKGELCIAMVVLFYLFFSKEAANYARLQMIYFFSIYFVFSYFGRLLMKRLIAIYYKSSRSYKQILLVTTSDKVNSILEKIETTNNWYFKIAYIVLIDRKAKGETIQGIPVIANVEDMLEETKNIALDDVFLNIGYGNEHNFDVRRMLHDFQNMGVIVHVNVDALELDMTNKRLENLGFFKVVSYSSNLYEPGQLVIKRLMDLVGGLIGLIITIIVGIFVVPAIKLESKGPAIYTSTRVGKNGRHFKMYKFRSMYADADARKAELIAKNEMQGAMFKMENDPRITKVGKFIRKHSIDELPQFLNVLKGDMSLVGTRPPTVEEVEQYKTEQKRRLSVTPGITGLWQVSGRSDIYSFDEIVKLDLEYIDQWSIGLDIKLLFKTIAVMFTGEGAK